MANSGINARTPASNGVSPIALLRDQVTKLDAAVLVCRATPKKEPVHTLRKTTRYVEAQLALLQQIPGLPQHEAEADKVRKRLKSVRKAAGVVRDFDVQRKLVKDDAPAKDAANTANAANTATAKDGSVDDRLQLDAKALAKHLKRQRQQETGNLTQVLRAEEKRLAKALRKLEAALEEAEQRTVPSAQLAENIERWFLRNTPHVSARARNHGNGHQRNGDHANRLRAIERLDEESLHTLRKASKLCRYMAESLPEGFPTAKRLVDRFEQIQESGGQWHDWLLLERIAAKREGSGAALTARYSQHRDAALAEYQTRLAELLPTRQNHTAKRTLTAVA
jgi:CHAD domain-containing protein